MSIVTLREGERHSFALSALRVQVTGSAGGVQIQALDQSGVDVTPVRLGPTEIVLTPQPRRLRLTAVPTDGGTFPSGTMIGLTLFTEGASAVQEQVLVSPYDAGALDAYEVGVLEFAADRSVLSVSSGRPVIPNEKRVDVGFVSANPFGSGPISTTATATAPSEADHAWLRAGRYALRDAARTGHDASRERATAWGVVLDGSISMLQLHAAGALDELLELVCGTFVSWTGAWPRVCYLAGATTSDVPDAVTSPRALSQALAERQPWSGSLLSGAVRAVTERVGPGGHVVVVTDGVPGDVAELTQLAREMTDRHVCVVTTGTSAWGLPSDVSGRSWWQEELGGLDELASLPHVSIAAIRTRPDGRLELEGSRAAEVASRLVSASVVTG